MLERHKVRLFSMITLFTVWNTKRKLKRIFNLRYNALYLAYYGYRIRDIKLFALHRMKRRFSRKPGWVRARAWLIRRLKLADWTVRSLRYNRNNFFIIPIVQIWGYYDFDVWITPGSRIIKREFDAAPAYICINNSTVLFELTGFNWNGSNVKPV